MLYAVYSQDVHGILTSLLDPLCPIVQWDAIEDKPTAIVYATGAIAAVWLSSTLVSAINSVPLVSPTHFPHDNTIRGAVRRYALHLHNSTSGVIFHAASQGPGARRHRLHRLVPVPLRPVQGISLV